MTTTHCPTNDMLQDYLDGAWPVDEHRAVADHIVWCDTCREELEHLQVLVGRLEVVLPGPPPAIDAYTALAQLKRDPRYQRAMISQPAQTAPRSGMDQAKDMGTGGGDINPLGALKTLVELIFPAEDRVSAPSMNRHSPVFYIVGGGAFALATIVLGRSLYHLWWGGAADTDDLSPKGVPSPSEQPLSTVA